MEGGEALGQGDVARTEKRVRLNMGPQHPSTHGVLRLALELDGEQIVACKPDIGFLHTGIEKISETRNWTQNITHYPRLDYLSPMNNEMCYCMAVEKLLQIQVPRRAQYIRVLMSELTRIISHLVWLGTHAIDIGAMSVFLYCFIEREKILKFYEAVGGQRMMTSYMRIGGVVYDLPDGFEDEVGKFLNEFPARIKLYESLLTKNPIWIRRTKGVAAMSAEDSIAHGLSGPLLRAAGVDWDIRRDNPYLVYPELDFDIPIGENGDIYDRYLVRMEEMKQSVRICEQCLRELKKMGKGEGELDHMARHPKYTPPPRHKVQDSIEELIHHFKYWTEGIHPPIGEAYANIEASKGELGFWVISDGTAHPWRVKIRPPSFVNLSAIEDMVRGQLIADVVAAIGSLDIVLGEIDR
ncbi:MAG: NADH-quinone oxidoreductase subunit D [bacterium]